jgi:hypothetical protein
MTTNNVSYGVGSLGSGAQIALNSTAIGAFAQNKTTTGASNVAVGTNAMLNNTTGDYNTGLGTATLLNQGSSSSNTAVGSNAMQGASSAAGDGNTAVGAQSLYSYFGANNNTAMGRNALLNMVQGQENTVLGYNAGLSLVNDGSGNTLVGANTNTVDRAYHSTAIGYGAKATASNQIMLGTAADTVVIPGLLVNGSTTIYYNDSYEFVQQNLIDMSSNTLSNINAANVFFSLPLANIPFDKNLLYRVCISFLFYTKNGGDMIFLNSDTSNNTALISTTLAIDNNTNHTFTILPISTSTDQSADSGFNRGGGTTYSDFFVTSFQNYNSYGSCEFYLLPSNSVETSFNLRYCLILNNRNNVNAAKPYISDSNTPTLSYSLSVTPVPNTFLTP